MACPPAAAKGYKAAAIEEPSPPSAKEPTGFASLVEFLILLSAAAALLALATVKLR
jgi:hypothetical protein